MNYLMQFGSYVLPSTLRPDDPFALAYDLAEQERPRAAGSVSQAGRVQSRALPVRGEITLPVAADLHDLIEEIKGNLAGYQNLYYGRDDRFYVAQLESITGNSKDGKTFGKFFGVSLVFKASDPYAYDATPTTQTETVPTTFNVTNGGTAETNPKWTLTINVAATDTISLINHTTGETGRLIGDFAHYDVIELNRDGYTVKRNGTAEYGLLRGYIPRLVPGVNAIEVTAAVSDRVSEITVDYTDRYL